MRQNPANPRWPWLTRTLVALCVVSLLTDAASEMIAPLLPLYLTTLGAGPLALGLIEGVAELVASVLKLVAGWLSDRAARRKPLVVAGYTVSSLVRPLVALAGSAGWVLLVRAVDRVGKGLRTSPRDALIAAATPPAAHARAFAFHRAMDHSGALLGPLFAFLVLRFWSTDLRVVFALAAVPSALAVLALLFVRERPTCKAPAAPLASGEAASGRPVGLLAALFVFSLGNASESFLLLYAAERALPVLALPLLWMALHAVKVGAALLGGPLADRYGRRRAITLGWCLRAAVCAAFALAGQGAAVLVLFLAWGVHSGLTEGAERALVAQLAPARAHGAAFGLYHLTLGVAGLLAGVLFGACWQRFGAPAAFAMSGALSLLGAALVGVAGRAPRARDGAAQG